MPTNCTHLGQRTPPTSHFSPLQPHHSSGTQSSTLNEMGSLGTTDLLRSGESNRAFNNLLKHLKEARQRMSVFCQQQEKLSKIFVNGFFKWVSVTQPAESWFPGSKSPPHSHSASSPMLPSLATMLKGELPGSQK